MIHYTGTYISLFQFVWQLNENEDVQQKGHIIKGKKGIGGEGKNEKKDSIKKTKKEWQRTIDFVPKPMTTEKSKETEW